MSCKYCKPIEGCGVTEPLLETDAGDVRIVGNRLIMGDAAIVIDRCPVCGESLRPFGLGAALQWRRRWQ